MWRAAARCTVQCSVLMLGTIHQWLENLRELIKGCGVCTTEYGSIYTELHNLRGRGAAAVDWEVELNKHLKSHTVPGMLAHFPEGELRRAVRQVVASELGGKPHFADAETVFKRQYATTKAGSHSAAGSRIASEFMDAMDIEQPTRRNFMEAGYGSIGFMEAEVGSTPRIRQTVTWRGDWDLFRRKFKAAARHMA